MEFYFFWEVTYVFAGFIFPVFCQFRLVFVYYNLQEVLGEFFKWEF